MTLLGLVSCAVTLYFAGHWMRVNEQPVKADYILPLAGDYNRLISAADLYKNGYAPAILLSNAAVFPPDRIDRLRWEIGFPKYTRDQYRVLILQALGAESAELEPFGNGHISTTEEAEALKDHLNGKSPDLLIVTSPYHARRAKLIFEDYFPESQITVTTIREDSFYTQWWKDQASAQNLIMEFAKTLHYLMGGAFRSTDKADN